MKIVLISDTHTKEEKLNLPEGDLLLHAGDLSYDGHLACLNDFNEWCGRQKAKFKYGIVAIAGNHDLTLDPNNIRYKPAAKDLFTNFTYLDDSGTEINGLKIWGSPIQPWFHDWAFNRQRGTEIKDHWDLIPDTTDVLITHGPPYGILDKPFGRRPSVGCVDLLEAVNRIKPKLHVFGHIHGDYGIQVVNGITFVNASSVDEAYAPVHKPIVVEISGMEI